MFLKRVLLAATLLVCLGSQAFAAIGDTYQSDNVALYLLQLNSESTWDNAQRFAGAAPGLQPRRQTFQAYGQDYNFYYLSIDDYARLFRVSGGPTIRSIVGIDFSFICNPRDARYGRVFAIYTAFLCLVVGFHWFNMVGEVASGKGPTSMIPIVVPLVGKAAVGMLVAYNLPLVYGYAMTMKNVGQSMVMWVLQGSPEVAETMTSSDPGKLNNLNDKQKGIMDGLQEVIKELAFIQDDPNPPRDAEGALPEGYDRGIESNRRRLAMAVAYLNYYIHEFYENTQMAVPVHGEDGVYEYIPHSADPTERKLIHYVAAQPGDPMDKMIIFKRDAPPPSPENPNPVPLPPALLSIEQMVPTTSGQIGNFGEVIYNNLATDLVSSTWLAEEFVKTLKDFMLVSGNVIDGRPDNADTLRILNEARATIDGDYFVESEEASIAVNPTPGIILDYATTAVTAMNPLYWFMEAPINGGAARQAFGDSRDFLGARLAGIQRDGSYVSSIAAATKQYADDILLEPNLIEELRPKWWGGTGALGVIKETAVATLEMIAAIPQMFAQFFLWITKAFWIPMIAHLANFLFNITIEAYVYIIWLAYPFWFHKKTEQAFKGALNTMFSVCFTAATFTLLALMFEAFAGHLMKNVIGSAASGAITGTAIAVSLYTGGLGALALNIGIGIGYSIFYMIGTALCLTLAPKIFKAFLSGSSVVTPMMMGAATAVVGGALGGILAGTGFAGAGIGAGVMKAASAKAGAAATKAGAALKNTRVAQGVSRMASNIKNSGVGQRVSQAARAVTTPSMGMARAAKKGSLLAASVMDGAKMIRGVRNTATNLAKNPGQALKNFASSKTAQMAVVVAAGASGDLNKLLNTSGVAMFGPQLLQNLQGKNAATTPETAKGDFNKGSSAAGGSSLPSKDSVTSPIETQKRKTVIENEVTQKDIKVSSPTQPLSPMKLKQDVHIDPNIINNPPTNPNTPPDKK